MPFDLGSAKPVTAPSPGGFDLSSAQPVDRVAAYMAKNAALHLHAEEPEALARVGRGMVDVGEGARLLSMRGVEKATSLVAPETAAKIGALTDAEAENNRREIELYNHGREGHGFDWLRMGGQAAASLPIGAISGGSGLAGAVASGAVQGGLSGALTAEGEGKDPVTGAAIGVGAGGLLGAAGKAVTAGARGLWNHIAKGYPGSVQDAAVQKVLQRIGADQKAGGPSAQDAVDAVNAARAVGKPMSLADVGGENVTGLAGAVARQPGESRAIATRALEGRDQGAGVRISQDINQGIASGSASKTTHALMDARSANAAPLYQQAFDANPSIASKTVDSVLETPAGRRALAAASEKMQNDMTLMAPRDADAAAQMREAGQMVPKEGVASGLSLRSLDYVKRALDDQISTARRAGENDNARILTGLKSKLVGALDAADPTGHYQAARAAYSGPSQSIEALENGKDILRKTPDEIQQEMTGLNPSDKEFYRLGAANKLKEMVAKTGANGDEARKIVGNAYVRSQLRPLFDSDSEFDRFVESVGHESTMFKTATKVLGNSATAKRLAEDHSGDLQSMIGTARGIGHLTHGNLIGAAAEAIRMKRELGMRAAPELNSAIARILFDQGPHAMGGLAPSGAAIAPPVQRGLGRLVGGAAPAAGGLSTAIEQDQPQPAALAP